MGINSNTVNLGASPLPATAFQARTPGSASGPMADEHKSDADQGSQANGATGSAGPGGDADSGTAKSSGAATGSTAPAATAGPHSGRQAGPSAQTRGNARKASARSSTTSAGSQAGTDAADSAADAATNFGSVMASALDRSGATTSERPAQSKAAADGTDSGSGTASQPTAAPPDAVAWVAQVLLPLAAPPAAAAATDTPDTSAADTLPGPFIAQNAAGQSPTAAASSIRARINANPLSQPDGPAAGQITSQTTNQTTNQTGDAQTAATAPSTATIGNLNALADAQKLISGLTGTNPPADSGSGAVAASAAHPTAATGSADAATVAAGLQASSLARPATGQGTATLSIQSSVGSAAFADEVGSRVTNLAQTGITQAQLQLNPADLGPVQVHITMQSGQASVWFGATHSDTRAALEQSLPRLREMFAGAGMPLADSGVFREPPQQPQAQPPSPAGSARVLPDETATTTTVTQVANVRLALLDTYA